MNRGSRSVSGSAHPKPQTIKAPAAPAEEGLEGQANAKPPHSDPGLVPTVCPTVCQDAAL